MTVSCVGCGFDVDQGINGGKWRICPKCKARLRVYCSKRGRRRVKKVTYHAPNGSKAQ